MNSTSLTTAYAWIDAANRQGWYAQRSILHCAALEGLVLPLTSGNRGSPIRNGDGEVRVGEADFPKLHHDHRRRASAVAKADP
jgi:hypothetical protein